ncbi:histidinol-phosphatase HisJ family protein [Sulfurospirillum arcachonense]|uniref:histidinol-phosphatase HisJ family protein n=1 Tax=Sulfurospirillum arcachonense TaxID=57666 RepID=UPI00046964B4|nr:histidinol-phosphatase HisJ family protein [Sulfurospirillum arcachonense]
MSVDLHNHTILCKHATGTAEEYVKKAIIEKIKYFGFSDHAPMNFDPKYRMKFEQMQEYEKTILHVKEKFKNDINVLLAYEVDFLNGYIDERVLKADVDYLIGSVHFIGKWGFDNPEFIGEYKNKDINKIWEDYFEAIECLAKSKLFHIIGHIDLIKVFNFLPTKDIKSIANKAIQEIKKANIVVEINAAGFRKPVKEAYPSKDIMELLAQNDIPITFSSDAHAPEQVGYKKNEIYKYAKSFGYNKCATFLKKERKMITF